MLVKMLIAFAAVAVAIVATRPPEFRVARTATIAAPAPAVFAHVNDFRKWEAWNPWAKIDPAMKQAYEGAPAGAGAIYTWTGNNEVGEGRIMDMDKMIGGNFEKGLADMKSVVESTRSRG